jgi:hypothetical protein
MQITIQMDCFKRVIYAGCIGSLLLFSVSCDKEPAETGTGVISVSVIDNDADKTPVPDVDITITPGDIYGKTDAFGTATFEVDTGDYYVDADVCCIGPGFIQYHESVKVLIDDTAKVELSACLRCL